MPELNASKRAKLPDSAFAYIDSRGQRRLPINDEGHVRNALARFNQVTFENEEARERARKRLLNAAKKYKIVPVGFITGQLHTERELGRSQRDTAILPTGFVTLMLTDIEGSTALVHRLGDDYGKLIREVRRITRKIVIGNHGQMVDVRADESFAVFKRTSAAVESAVEIQRGLGQRGLGQRGLGQRGLGQRGLGQIGIGDQQASGTPEVRIRIGLHSGRPTVSDDSYIGIAVHTAARVCSAAHGGQIVLSAQTREALKELASGISFRSLGHHRLRGLPDPLTLYQVKAEGLIAKFPPPNIGTM